MEIKLAELCQLGAKSLIEDPDVDTIKKELKDAFRIYDKDGQGWDYRRAGRGWERYHGLRRVL